LSEANQREGDILTDAHDNAPEAQPAVSEPVVKSALSGGVQRIRPQYVLVEHLHALAGANVRLELDWCGAA
jgi:hypothetical protein